MMDHWWHEILKTVQEEFSDLPSIAQLTRVVVRLIMAATLGGVVGFEREHKGKSAGLRTHMLVAIGAAVFVMIPQQAGISRGDLARVIQGVVTGVGFLGAGTIIKDMSKRRIRGLTTAAGIWMTAAIGVGVGLGREASAALSTALAVGILAMSHRIVRWFAARDQRARKPSERITASPPSAPDECSG